MLLWLALLISQLIFVVVLFVAKPEVFKFDFAKPLLPADNGMFITILFFVAVMNVIISVVLRSTFINKAINSQKILLVQTAMIVGCALAESASILGFVSAFVFSYQYFFLFFIVGISGTLIHFPQRKNFINASFKQFQ